MTCPYCLKRTCRHVAHPESRATTQTQVYTTVYKTDRSLFDLHDLRSLRCVLCGKVIPPGCDQAYLRAYHAHQHVTRGEAVADRHGLPEGAVRYLVV